MWIVMTSYTVTASNAYFYQQLIVEASDIDAAADKMRAYLAQPEQQAEEQEEYEMGRDMFLDGEGTGCPPHRQDYQYSFHEDRVTKKQKVRS
jgi:hypothetical protein